MLMQLLTWDTEAEGERGEGVGASLFACVDKCFCVLLCTGRMRLLPHEGALLKHQAGRYDEIGGKSKKSLQYTKLRL